MRTQTGLGDAANVTAVDQQFPIADLKKGGIPIYEPGLTELVKRNTAAGRLKFTINLKEAVDNSLLIFLAVGTPSAADGSADISAVLDVAGEQLEPTPEFGASINTDFILAMGKVAEKVIMLLDVDKVLSTREVEAMHGATLKK